jgi:hypothetical protein
LAFLIIFIGLFLTGLILSLLPLYASLFALTRKVMVGSKSASPHRSNWRKGQLADVPIRGSINHEMGLSQFETGENNQNWHLACRS